MIAGQVQIAMTKENKNKKKKSVAALENRKGCSQWIRTFGDFLEDIRQTRLDD